MLLYHRSIDVVKNIDLSFSKVRKDFGKGFYVTFDKLQAINFANIVYSRKMKDEKYKENKQAFNKILNVYKINNIEDLKIFVFESADISWLHYIAYNRTRKLFKNECKIYDKYDIICGKIPNDQTNETLTIYLSGGYGVPGTDTADNTAINILLPNKLAGQYCFKNMNAISKLRFIESVKL